MSYSGAYGLFTTSFKALTTLSVHFYNNKKVKFIASKIWQNQNLRTLFSIFFCFGDWRELVNFASVPAKLSKLKSKDMKEKKLAFRVKGFVIQLCQESDNFPEFYT